MLRSATTNLLIGTLTVALVGMARFGHLGLAFGLCVAALLLGLVVLGSERLGFVLLAGGFLTAPMYKGIGSVGPVTPTDAFLALGFMLLLPRLLARRVRMAPSYLLAASVVAVAGLVATLATISPIEHLTTLIFWVAVFAALPIAMGHLQPAPATIDSLAWCFVVGHLISTAWGLIHGPYDGRYVGFTQHPNAFGESGLLAVAILLHLAHRTSRRWLVGAAMAICLLSIYLSGSRGATLVVVGVLALIPVVERSALWAYVVTFGGVLLATLLLTAFSHASGDSSLGRLEGNGSSVGSDQARTNGLHAGWQLFHAHPLSGTGLLQANLVDIHNNYLEVAVAIGLIGFLGYLALLTVLGKGLFGTHPMRRLCYAVAAYAAFGATTPSLTDRTIWVAISLSAVVLTRPPRRQVPTGLLVPGNAAEGIRSPALT